jgi:hypothetical protein
VAKKVRKKTKKELAEPAFRKRVSTQSEVLMRAFAECEKLSQKRRQFVLDVADNAWIRRFEHADDTAAFEKESRRWDKLSREFIKSVDKPREIHCFTCNYNASRGMKPLIRLMKHPLCDAGTALRLFWLNDPVYFSEYGTITECPYEEEQDVMRLLRTIKLRFKRNDFKSRNIYFDPEPWIQSNDVDLEVLQLPESMLTAIPRSSRSGR